MQTINRGPETRTFYEQKVEFWDSDFSKYYLYTQDNNMFFPNKRYVQPKCIKAIGGVYLVPHVKKI